MRRGGSSTAPIQLLPIPACVRPDYWAILITLSSHLLKVLGVFDPSPSIIQACYLGGKILIHLWYHVSRERHGTCRRVRVSVREGYQTDLRSITPTQTMSWESKCALRRTWVCLCLRFGSQGRRSYARKTLQGCCLAAIVDSAFSGYDDRSQPSKRRILLVWLKLKLFPLNFKCRFVRRILFTRCYKE